MTQWEYAPTDKDVPLSLYSIGGKGYLWQPAEPFIAEFKDLLTPNHAQKNQLLSAFISQ